MILDGECATQISQGKAVKAEKEQPEHHVPGELQGMKDHGGYKAEYKDGRYKKGSQGRTFFLFQEVPLFSTSS